MNSKMEKEALRRFKFLVQKIITALNSALQPQTLGICGKNVGGFMEAICSLIQPTHE